MIKPSVVRGSDCLADVTPDSQIVDSSRATLYGILGRLYGHELTLEFAQELHQAGFFGMLTNVEPGFTVEENLQSVDFESLAVEFSRLFI